MQIFQFVCLEMSYFTVLGEIMYSPPNQQNHVGPKKALGGEDWGVLFVKTINCPGKICS